MREYEHVPDAGHERQHAVHASSHLACALAAGTAIAPQVPARIARANLGRGQTFIFAIVPFAQLIAEDRAVAKIGLLIRFTRAAQGAAQHHREASFGQLRPQSASLIAARLGQSSPCVDRTGSSPSPRVARA